MFCISAKIGSAKGRSWPVGGRPLIFGRGSDCDIRILDPVVSRRHCEVFVSGDCLQLQDLGSRNRALVNGIPVESSRLELGDEIRVGGAVFFITKAERIETQQALERCSTMSLAEEESVLLSLSVSSSLSTIPSHSQRDLHSLFSTCMRLSGASSRKEVDALIGRALVDHFHPSGVWLLLLHNNEEEICCLHSTTSRPAPKDLMLSSLTNQVGALFPEKEGVSTKSPGWVLAAPICLAGHQIGALAVAREGEAQFGRDDLDYLVALACLISPSLRVLEQIEELQRENLRLRISDADLSVMVGSSSAVARIKTLIRAAASSVQNVLITGETGTGKELVAKLIHSLSERQKEKLIIVNCAAIPMALFESELFGHEKGAFTDAGARKFGLMEESDGGTLFLDEVGDLTLENQSKILRAVETKSFRRVGGSSEIYSDCRIVAATNKDLRNETRLGCFREDLYHRLNIIHIQLPPLRERASDIPELAQHFLDACSSLEKRKRQFAGSALDYLLKREWSGNIRELKNIVERAVALSQKETIECDDFGVTSYAPSDKPLSGLSLQEAEQVYVAKALQASNNNVVEAAKLLGISKSTLYNKLNRHRLL